MTETPKEAARRFAEPMLAKGFKPVALHTYHDLQGQPIYHRIRLKHPETGEKWIRPMKLNGQGYELGEPPAPASGRCLYALHRIASNPDAAVWVVEGEQKADALERLGLVATTSGGAQSAVAANWQPLRGRTCIIWPDNDEAGKAYAGGVASILLAMGCAVSCVDVDMLGLPHNGDVIDWLAAHPVAAVGDLEALPRLTPHYEKENTPAGNSVAWPDPVPFDEVATPEIPARLLPGVLGDFAAALANATETPEAMATMTVLGVVSAALTKRFCVSPKDGWREPVNIYTLVALPPGNTKSAVFNACTSLLVEWEREQAILVEPEIKRLVSERKSQEKLIEAKRGKLAKEEDPKMLKDMVRDIADMEANLETPPPLPQLFATNATTEQIENGAYQQGGRFAVLSDEGGIMEVFSGLYSGGKANIDVVLQGIDGGPVRVRRKDRNFDLNPFLTFVLTVQPVIVQRMGEARAFSGRGLLERFMWVLPQSKLGYRTHDTAAVPDATAQGYRQTLRKLLEIPPVIVDGIEHPRVLMLSPGALAEWSEFRKAIEVELRPSGRLAICQGWGGKISGFALRFAGLLHVVTHISDISVETMDRALELSALLIEHAIAAYGLMGIDQATQDAKDCWHWIEAQGAATFKKADLTRHMRHRMNVDRIDKALKALDQRGLIGPSQRIPGSKSIYFPVRPELVGGGA